MTYLGYFEVLEGSGWQLSDDLKHLKSQWCFTMRIFETPELTQEDLDDMPKPRYPKIKSMYKLIYSEGNLMHEKE
jgi:hypothetical protein